MTDVQAAVDAIAQSPEFRATLGVLDAIRRDLKLYGRAKVTLVARPGVTEEVEVTCLCPRVIHPRKVYDEPRPFVRTAATIFQGPRFHWVHDVYRLGADGRYYYRGTE